MIDATPSQDPSQFSQERLREIERLLEEKEAQLRDRDRTVQELTKRLAQSAERLDRVRRSGSDGPVIQTAAFPKEVVEQQSELVDDLQRAVQLWENMQLSCGLGGLQMQLSDLEALFEEHFREKEPAPEPTADEAETQSLEAGEQQEEPIEEWELAAELGSPETLADGAEQPAVEEDVFPPVEEVCPLRPPDCLNLSDASLEDLKTCVEQQDAYIDYLSVRLQRVAEKKSAVDWLDLADKPEKLTSHLEHTAKKLLESRHLAELELSLQRTRLKRRERELKELSEDLAVQMQSVDLHPDPETGKETPGGRRWMRMLGMGKNESE